jgi:hypothetical protein
MAGWALCDGKPSLLGLIAFERVVVIFIVLAGLIQLFRVAAHMAERAGFLFFREFSASLRTSSRAEHDSETVTLSHPVMPIADGLGS